MLFVPGNHPAMIQDAYIYGSDSIMFDLEDSVSPTEKDSARALVYEALTTLTFNGIETVVRINPVETEHGIQDLEAIVRARPNVIRLPKTEDADDVRRCEAEISRIEKASGIKEGSTKMMAAIESAAGVLNAREIAFASRRLIGIALGAEDYVTNMKTDRSAEGTELLFARSMILHAARAAGIAAIDTVYSDVENEEGLRREALHIKQLGFDGKSVINPRQIAIINEIYRPTDKEIKKARDIIHAIEEAKKKGSGVISLNGKMIDKPIVERAERVLSLAYASGIIKEL